MPCSRARRTRPSAATAPTTPTGFDDPPVVGVASGLRFPDALAGGANIATRVGPILLSTPGTPIPGAVYDYVRELPAPRRAIVYGGSGTIGDDVVSAIGRALA